MKSELHRTQDPADAPNGSTMTFQRPVPRIRSFRSIFRSPGDQDEPPTRTDFKQDSQRLKKRKFFWTSQATEASAEDKQRRQSHVLYENKLFGTSSTALRPSHKHGWKEDLNKSFIDISPDRNARSKGRRIIGKERMRSLLSKANELFSWGRSQRREPLQQGGRHF